MKLWIVGMHHRIHTRGGINSLGGLRHDREYVARRRHVDKGQSPNDRKHDRLFQGMAHAVRRR
jgi:hypothetical protein